VNNCLCFPQLRVDSFERGKAEVYVSYPLSKKAVEQDTAFDVNDTHLYLLAGEQVSWSPSFII
jgi:hypothetical protein